ncbi:hypothetical protein CDN99_17085 [Roseateles aquatilis]|uniref:Sel1 repeat family protein n=1 Tax=Roseateles aquatilis TaxID=431061 RepID=A0A246J7E8_9BURK|nr:hypothetical protein CDN99_17085 [Roseateles aquatilis]
MAAAVGIVVWRGEPGHEGEATAAIETTHAQGVIRAAGPSPEGGQRPMRPAGQEQAAPSAIAIEFAAPWSALIHFETDEERRRRIFRSDPFDVVAALPTLMERAAKGEAEAALHLHSLAETCDARQSAINPPAGFIPLDCSAPRAWSEEQRRSLRSQAVLSGDPSPALSMLKEAESMPIDHALREDTIADAVLSLDFAGRRGCLECLVALAEIHREGRLVSQDLRRSFAYLQVAAVASGEASYAQLAEAIRPSLRPIDVEFARTLQERLAKALERNKAR